VVLGFNSEPYLSFSKFKVVGCYGLIGTNTPSFETTVIPFLGMRIFPSLVLQVTALACIKCRIFPSANFRLVFRDVVSPKDLSDFRFYFNGGLLDICWTGISASVLVVSNC